MHDRNGTPLKSGDVVLVPCTVKTVYGGTDFCNVTLQSLYGRLPDGMQETMTLNSAVTIKATLEAK